MDAAQYHGRTNTADRVRGRDAGCVTDPSWESVRSAPIEFFTSVEC